MTRADLKTLEVQTAAGLVALPYEIQRKKRSRHIRVRMSSQNHALVVIPWHCPTAEALSFLRTQSDWLVKHMQAYPAKTALLDYLQKHPWLSATGEKLALTLSATQNKPFTVYSIPQQEIELRLRAGEEEADVRKLVRGWANEVISLRAEQLAKQVGVTFQRVSVRDQSSRWGSCSSTGTVSLNWRLVLLEPALQDHIIFHELAHLTEMNHSTRFWSLLQSYDPQTSEHNGQLNSVAEKLMPLGRL